MPRWSFTTGLRIAECLREFEGRALGPIGKRTLKNDIGGTRCRRYRDRRELSLKLVPQTRTRRTTIAKHRGLQVELDQFALA